MRKIFVACLMVLAVVSWGYADTLDQYNVATNPATGHDMNGIEPLAQTFTAGLTGQLTGIEFMTYRFGEDTSGLPTAVEIWTTEIDCLFKTLLGVLWFNDNEIPDGWNLLDLSNANIFVTSGVQYTILLHNNKTPSIHNTYYRASDGLPLNGDTETAPFVYEHPEGPEMNIYDWYIGGEMWIYNQNNDEWVSPQWSTGPGVAPAYSGTPEDLMFRTYVDTTAANPCPEPSLLLLLGIGLSGLIMLKRG